MRPVVTTKFGPYSAVILHLVTRILPDVPIVWVNTGLNTRATLRHSARLIKLLDLNLKAYLPLNPWDGMTPEIGDEQFGSFVKQVKLEPFGRAMAELDPDVWVAGLRREQTDYRNQMSLFERSENGRLKISPLFDWHKTELTAYLGLHDLPVGGDYHDPTKSGPRAECGIHINY